MKEPAGRFIARLFYLFSSILSAIDIMLFSMIQCSKLDLYIYIQEEVDMNVKRIIPYAIGAMMLFAFPFLFFGEPENETGVVSVVSQSADAITGTDFFLVALITSLVACGLWVWITYAYSDKTKTKAQRLQGSKNLSWILALTVGIPVFHWLFWSTKPELWTTWFESTNFWPVNFAVVLTVLFLSQKGGLPRLVGLALGLYLVVLGIARVNDSSVDHISVAKPASIQSLSTDIVLTTIADCESGDCSPGSARQFEADGVTPLRNREGSSALGMWQILASTAQDKCQDIDIRTLEGNKACARRLYDESGTKHWEADPRSVARWKPILLALGDQLSDGETTFVVTVGPDEWSKVYRYQGSRTVDHRAIGPQKRIAMMTESGVYHFTPEKSDIVPDPVNWARFKSLTDSPENVRVTLSR